MKAGPPVWRAGGDRLALMHSTPVFSPLVTRFLPFMVTCGAGHKGTCVRPPRAALGCVCPPPASLISLAYRRCRCRSPDAAAHLDGAPVTREAQPSCRPAVPPSPLRLACRGVKAAREGCGCGGDGPGRRLWRRWRRWRRQGPGRQTQQGVVVCGGGGADSGGDDRRQGWEAL